MKAIKYLLACLLPLAAACSTEDIISPSDNPENHPVEVPDSVPETPQRDWKPTFSRASSPTATVAGFTAAATRAFQTDMVYDGIEWQWTDGTAPALGESAKIICTVPSLNSTASTRYYYSPSQNDRLQWDCVDVSEQKEDNSFHFTNVTHRVAQMRVIVNRYFSVDELKAYCSQYGYFNCLTGMFDEVASPTGRNVVPQNDGNGNYIYTFTIVPQTFKAGTTLLTYKDIYSDGYYTYRHVLDRDITIDPNERLVVEATWGEDWEGGEYTETRTNVALSVTVADWEVNETIDGSASENN